MCRGLLKIVERTITFGTAINRPSDKRQGYTIRQEVKVVVPNAKVQTCACGFQRPHHSVAGQAYQIACDKFGVRPRGKVETMPPEANPPAVGLMLRDRLADEDRAAAQELGGL